MNVETDPFVFSQRGNGEGEVLPGPELGLGPEITEEIHQSRSYRQEHAASFFTVSVEDN